MPQFNFYFLNYLIKEQLICNAVQFLLYSVVTQSYMYVCVCVCVCVCVREREGICSEMLLIILFQSQSQFQSLVLLMALLRTVTFCPMSFSELPLHRLLITRQSSVCQGLAKYQNESLHHKMKLQQIFQRLCVCV